MIPLELEDARHLQAAQGWLELGSHLEANAELDQITPAFQEHLAVLVVRYEVYAKAEQWAGAHEIARTLAEAFPEQVSFWIWRAYAVRRMAGGGLEQAQRVLAGVVEKFPREWVVAYNLACYACQLGNLPEAWTWLEQAIQVAGRDEIKLKALEDADLEPLWPDIGKL